MLRQHPTVRLSHIQPAADPPLRPKQHLDADFMVEKSKYHDAMTKTISAEFNQHITKTLAPPSSRDTNKTLPSLAATHPANYSAQARKMMPPPPPPLHRNREYVQTLPSHTLAPRPHGPTLESSPAEAPWRQYTDPMWQTSSDPHYWSRNRTVLKSDCNIEIGNVTSPTWMIGLPFGGMTEMAMCYPQVEQGAIKGDRSRDKTE